LSAGGNGFTPHTLLQDCVPSTFAAIAAVCSSVHNNHFCCWHVKDSLQNQMKEKSCFSTATDVVDPVLFERMRRGDLTLATALKQQADLALHSYNSIILCLEVKDAAVLMQGFLSIYSGNAKLMSVLSKEPYNNLRATLFCFCPGCPAINAESEVCFRQVRALQCSPMGGRM